MKNPLEKYLRDNPEITTDMFARKANISYITVSNIRCGRKPVPNVIEALKIERATKGVVPPSAWEK